MEQEFRKDETGELTDEGAHIRPDYQSPESEGDAARRLRDKGTPIASRKEEAK